MSIGAAPNLSGGLWTAGTSQIPTDLGNGNANTSSPNICAGSGTGSGTGEGPGGGNGGGGGTCSVSSGSNGGQNGSGGMYQVFSDMGSGSPSSPLLIGGGAMVPPTCVPTVLPQGATPPPVFDSGPYACGIEVYDSTVGGAVAGLSVTCAQTGVTLGGTNCSSALLTFPVPTGSSDPTVYNFSCPGGLGTNCSFFTHPTYTYNDGSAEATGNTASFINLTHA